MKLLLVICGLALIFAGFVFIANGGALIILVGGGLIATAALS